MNEKKYALKKTCFVGNKGDIISLRNAMDGTAWTNHTKNTMGCPFVEFDLIEEVQ